ncbi:MAG: phosphoglycerate kinase, partial [Patescibacteria group bacterium]
MASLPLLKDIPDLRGKRVLLRLDTDVPIESDKVRDAYRLDRARETLEFLRTQGARTLIVGHIG